MAANTVKNLWRALHYLPIASTTVWMDSMVALYWITNPGKQWKVFIANRVQKIAEITNEIGITWNYCPTSKNLADMGSRGIELDKLENSEWFTGPDWLLDKQQWSEQPNLKSSKEVNVEHKPLKETIFYNKESDPDEWTLQLTKNKYWRTLRVTNRLGFADNARAKGRRVQKRTWPLTTEEIWNAKDYLTKRLQRNISANLQTKGRIQRYRPTYIDGGLFADKLILHAHEQIRLLGTANRIAVIREEWWIPKLRSKVKKMINACNTCKVYRGKPFGAASTSAMPTFRTEPGRPFQTTGIDFAGPLSYRISKTELDKCYILIFTYSTTRAVHLAEEFQRKLKHIRC